MIKVGRRRWAKLVARMDDTRLARMQGSIIRGNIEEMERLYGGSSQKP